MADPEIEAEWAKSKRIEKEKMKATFDTEAAKVDANSLAHLDPSIRKKSGFVRDINEIMKHVETAASRSVILVVSGVVMGVISRMGSIISSSSKLGFAGALITVLPTALEMVCLGVGALMAVVTLIISIMMMKKGQKMTSVVWSAIFSLIILAIYIIVDILIQRIV